jgi:hypothetical protein
MVFEAVATCSHTNSPDLTTTLPNNLCRKEFLVLTSPQVRSYIQVLLSLSSIHDEAVLEMFCVLMEL